MGQASEGTRIYRGLRRRINRGKPLDSYPFLSGDSYFYSCQFYFESGMLLKVPSMPGRIQKDKSLFVTVGKLGKFLQFLEENPEEKYADFSLILHNGDDVISENFHALLLNRFRKIYAVNLLVNSQSSTPIPIGLENRNYFTNGIPKDFVKLIEPGLKITPDRDILLLQAFSIHTNRTEREACNRIAVQLGSKTLENSSPSNYRKALLESKYVLSPAGNGFDCHRTWEAMYLGAIPIVRRVHWPFTNMNLPVLLIDEWEDLLTLDLDAIYVQRNPTWSEDFWNSFYND